MTNVLITGGAGFAGTHMIEHLLTYTDWDIYSLERITAREDRLGALTHSTRIHRIYHDFIAEIPHRILRSLSVDYIIHMGAEVQGRGSLENPALFVRANTLGTFHLLEAARYWKPEKFIYVSSVDAVGEAPIYANLAEDAPLHPSNPYGAAKAAGEMLALSYFKAFRVPVSIVRTMNIFGPRQGVDKFVPMVVKNLLNNKSTKIHISPEGISGSRCYLHVREFVKALQWIIENGQPDIYHVVGPARTNEEIVKILSRQLKRIGFTGEPVLAEKSHDLHRLVKDTKLPASAYDITTVDEDLAETATWYQNNQRWLR